MTSPKPVTRKNLAYRLYMILKLFVEPFKSFLYILMILKGRKEKKTGENFMIIVCYCCADLSYDKRKNFMITYAIKLHYIYRETSN
jgi:hypothetical protein